jgi:hypothetical protein
MRFRSSRFLAVPRPNSETEGAPALPGPALKKAAGQERQEYRTRWNTRRYFKYIYHNTKSKVRCGACCPLKWGAGPRRETPACPADEDRPPTLGVTPGRWVAWPAAVAAPPSRRRGPRMGSRHRDGSADNARPPSMPWVLGPDSRLRPRPACGGGHGAVGADDHAIPGRHACVDLLAYQRIPLIRGTSARKVA